MGRFFVVHLWIHRKNREKPEAVTSGFNGKHPRTTGSPSLFYFYHGLRWFSSHLEVVLLLIEIKCRWCGVSLCLCRRCYRHQAYCSDECRRLGRHKSHREAQRRYRQTANGKKAHSLAENNRRHRDNEKKMADQSSRGEILSVITIHIERKAFGRCHLCGCEGSVVARFPRRE